MTFLYLVCSILGVAAITAILFDFDIDSELKEAYNYEAKMDAMGKAIKGKAND